MRIPVALREPFDGLARGPEPALDLLDLARLRAEDHPREVLAVEGDAVGVIDAELREGLPNGALAVGDGEEGLGGAVARHLELLFERPDGGMPQAGLHGRIVREVERPLIAKVLAATRGNQLQAAAVLGLNRNTLRKKIRELDIEVMRGPR